MKKIIRTFFVVIALSIFSFLMILLILLILGKDSAKFGKKPIGFGYFSSGDKIYYDYNNCLINDRYTGYFAGLFCIIPTVMRIDEVDTDTFTIINQNFAKDKNKVYCQGIPIVNADPRTFHVEKNNTENGSLSFPMTEYIGKDKNGTYYCEYHDAGVHHCGDTTKKIVSMGPNDADYMKSFEPNELFQVQNGRVDCCGILLNDVHLGSFEIIGINDAIDQNNIYHCNRQEYTGRRDMENPYVIKEYLPGSAKNEMKIQNESNDAKNIVNILIVD